MTAVSPSPASLAPPGRRHTLPLEEAHDVTLVGGKASALGRAMHAGIRVPAGFALTTHAFDEHLDAHGLRDRIDALSARVSRDSATATRESSRAIRELVMATPLTPELRAELFASAETLLACGPVVVRSSAVGEDGVGQSFAGQLDSILHVSSPSMLEEAVLACWASYWSERALFYRAARGLAPAGMGVVVQQQVSAYAAGVLFTDAGDDAMLAEYTAGLADALVAGSVDPERLSIERSTRIVRQLARTAGTTITLRAETTSALASAGEALERVFGGPQDVEWVIDQSGDVWIVQSRPITAPVVFTRDAAPHEGARRVAWSNANVNENFPRPISPLLYSIAAPGYTHYFRNLARAFGISSRRIAAMEPAFRQIIGVHAARMYYNLTSIHSVLRLAPFGKALAASFDTFVGADGANVEAATLDARGKARQIGELLVIAAKTTWQFAFLSRRIERFESTVDRFAERTSPQKLAAMSGAELRDALRAFMDIRCNRWLDASLADAASMVCYGALERLLKNADGGESSSASHTSLLKAIPNVISGEPVRRLWQLSRLIKRDPQLCSLFELEDSSVVLASLRRDARFASFNQELDRYLTDWGFRCSEELMLTSPSFQENPAPLIDMLRAYARLDGGSPDEALREQEAARIAETQNVLSQLEGRPLRRGLPFLTYANVLRVLLPWTHAAIRFRERARMKQALLYSRCRRIALAIGDLLVRRELATIADDVFYLTIAELDELLSGAAMFPDRTRQLVRLRREEQATLAAFTPPDAFTLREGEYLDPTAASEQRDAVTPTGTLRGTSACGGRATGRATVLRDVTEAERLGRGDVLVTRQTDPGWGPVFFLISGLVIERGGMLSHGAIIAREFGIPCVVGVRDATRLIPDGTTIMVDGDSGQVHVGS